jgi:hypothetical protein
MNAKLHRIESDEMMTHTHTHTHTHTRIYIMIKVVGIVACKSININTIYLAEPMCTLTSLYLLSNTTATNQSIN